MTKKDDFSNSYLRFLSLVSAMRALPSMPALDVTEELVLNTLAMRWQIGKQVTVMEAMEFATDVSPSTVHRRLKALRKKGLIVLQEDDTDNRTKYIQPTALAGDYFEKMGQCMASATNRKE